MSKEKETISSGGFGVCGLLGTAFVVLRLCGVIDWSWWWVLAPFWAPVALTAVCFVLLLVVIVAKTRS